MKVTSYVVFWLGAGNAMHNEFADMGEALEFCQELRKDTAGDITHIVMSSDNVNMVGEMGVSSVEGGKLPDGSDYTYTKRRYNERPKEPVICALCNNTEICRDSEDDIPRICDCQRVE